MFIKLLCVNTVDFYDYYGDKFFTIEEGKTIKALIKHGGICFEYKRDHYTCPYLFEDMSNNFISTFDEESYNKIYHKAKNLTMHFEDGSTIVLGDAIIKIK